jgi:D-sedoheptulose 7-phosphate isomerase
MKVRVSDGAGERAPFRSTAVDHYRGYAARLDEALGRGPVEPIGRLAEALLAAITGRQAVFLCGNGGSAGNAIHLANDFLFGMGKGCGVGLRVEALPSNPAILTCLANDLSYAEVFAEQLRLKGASGDLLIVLSGSGNSPNVVRALEVANTIGMATFAVLGYSGGRCLEVAQTPIHFAVDDMQIAEDLQLIVGHMCMQWVSAQLNAARDGRT